MNIYFREAKGIDQSSNIPYFPFSFTVVYLSILFCIVILVDFLELDFWLAHIIDDWTEPYPFFWTKMFIEGSITEYIQWFFLGGASILSIIRLAQARRYNESNIWIWIILFIGLFVMLIEDAFNIRHAYAEYVSASMFGADVETIDYLRSSLRTGLELSFYGLLGGIMCLSFIYIMSAKFLSWPGKKMLCCGYIFYAVAAIASVTRNINDWYIIVGTKIVDGLTSLTGSSWDSNLILGHKPVGFGIMDLLFEESLELLGAAFILGALAAFVLQSQRNLKGARTRI